jgi:hypothetical protein
MSFWVNIDDATTALQTKRHFASLRNCETTPRTTSGIYAVCSREERMSYSAKKRGSTQ